MIREELVNSAVTFLRDPSVAAAPIAKRVSFLQSKNLTKEEVDAALQRAGDGAPVAGPGPVPTVGPPQPYPSQGGYPAGGGYGHYGPNGYWPHSAHPESPGRDWRDWFIMATVVGGVGYGIYTTAKHYILPLIKPPTPPQLEQDKAKIDEDFNKAFALIDQLAADTAKLKESEEARTKKLDKALDDVDQVMKELRHQDRSRQDTIRQTSQSVRELHSAIPDTVAAQLKTYVKPLEDEMKSLRTLVDKRLTGTSPSVSSSVPRYSSPSAPTAAAGTDSSGPSAIPAQAAAGSVPGVVGSPSSTSSSTLASITSRAAKASIPSWQMAAAHRANPGSQPASTSSATQDHQASPKPGQSVTTS